MTEGSGYWVQPDETPDEVLAELRRHGIRRPLEAGDPMDERMPSESLRVILQIGIEYLARLGGAQTGDFVFAGVVNRGLVAYMRERERQQREWMGR